MVTDYPPETKRIFLASELSQWNPSDTLFSFTHLSTGNFALTLNSLPEEFKFTQGSWESVEVDAQGNDIANRKLPSNKADTLYFSISKWKSNQKTELEIPENVVLDTLYSRYLNRRVGLWLYHINAPKAKEIVLLWDGQNLFTSQTAFADEWQVDELLSELDTPYVVIGIENGEKDRIAEYTPFSPTQQSGGKGDSSLLFVVEELFPYLTSTYSFDLSSTTLTIGGSSLGGLMAAYALHSYPNLFQKGLVFSPAFWINPTWFDWIENYPLQESQTVVLYSGQKESAAIVSYTEQYHQKLLQQLPKKNVLFLIDPEGKHQEKYWRTPLVKGLQFSP